MGRGYPYLSREKDGASVTIEQAVLGCVLENPATWDRVASTLQQDHFALDSHQRIFAAMHNLADRSAPIDVISVREELGRLGVLEQIGNVGYLAVLVEGVIPENVGYYIAEVQKSARRRQYAKNAEYLTRLAADNTTSPDELRAATIATAETLSIERSKPPRFSEEAIALRFAEQYQSELRYVSRWGHWLRWDRTRWAEDDTLFVFDLCRGICREVSAECGEREKANAVRFASKATSAAVETLARADRRHAATPEQWDADPWLLNTPTGTIDLRRGEVREHSRADLITKTTAVGPHRNCTLWLQFLDRITAGDVELRAFLSE